MSDIVTPSAENVSLLERIRLGEVLARDCPSREILNHVCSRWGVLVLVVLLGGMHRFSELRRKIGGVSEKMLSQTLQSLEQDGFVDRKALPVVPPHVEYTLTPMGREVALQVDGLTTWIEQNLARILEARQARMPETLDQS
ncbi:winged helix-turn-helix transcriptional regulator [Pseudomonas bohemica]|uniref:winged helix-turn-helix transcriptional regulator n=1 Tax=Pseudomonas bohemica TaxID=2044872 RepID=UPI000DA60B9B|nr:helix-turn-helix domain-containing protein [Pseudomonas bohemica]